MADQRPSCLGCLGSLVLFAFIGSIFFGGGLLVRIGNFNLFFGNPKEQFLPDYTDKLKNYKDIIEKAVQTFQSQMYRGKCQDIYNRASDLFKKTVTPHEILKLCEIIPRTLGTLKSTKLIDTSIQSSNSENYILTRYMTEFDKGSAQETFVWLVKDKRAELVGYEIQPVRLMPGGDT